MKPDSPSQASFHEEMEWKQIMNQHELAAASELLSMKLKLGEH